MIRFDPCYSLSCNGRSCFKAAVSIWWVGGRGLNFTVPVGFSLKAPISGQSLLKRNCYNFKTSDDIDMKHWTVTKRDERNKTTSKRFDDDVMSDKWDVIATFLIYG